MPPAPSKAQLHDPEPAASPDADRPSDIPSRPISVAGLMIANGDGFVGRRVARLALGLAGLHGDRHAGMTRRADGRTPWHPSGASIANTRQISLVSLEECGEIAQLLGLGSFDPALLGPNLVLQGIASLSLTPAGTRLQFPSGATLFITEQTAPCRQPGLLIATAHDDRRLAAAFGRAAIGRRGLLALVERDGMVRTDDAVRLIAPRVIRPRLPRITV